MVLGDGAGRGSWVEAQEGAWPTGCIVAGRKLSGQKMTPGPNTHSTLVQQIFV